MLLRCCLIHITVIILKYTLYLVYLGLFLVLGLLMSYLWVYVSFIFSLIFVAINHITSLKPFNVCYSRKVIHSFNVISLNVSQRTSRLCQTRDAENFAKAFTGLLPLNILAKNSMSWCLMMFDENIRTLVKALLKQNSWMLVA